MEDSIIPTATAWRISRIVANHVEHGLGGADAKRLCILRHEKHMAALFDPDFVNKFREVSARVRFRAPLGSHPCRSPPEMSNRRQSPANSMTPLFSLRLRVALSSKACRNLTLTCKNRPRTCAYRCRPMPLRS